MKTRTTVRPRHLAIGAGSVLLLTFLFFKSTAINFAEHNEFSGNLHRLRELNATLNENILKARYGLVTSYDSLVIGTSEIGNVQKHLGSIPSFVEVQERNEIELQLNTQI